MLANEFGIAPDSFLLILKIFGRCCNNSGIIAEIVGLANGAFAGNGTIGHQGGDVAGQNVLVVVVLGDNEAAAGGGEGAAGDK